MSGNDVNITVNGGSIEGSAFAIGKDNRAEVRATPQPRPEHREHPGTHTFICYSSGDARAVQRLDGLLRARRIPTWLDERAMAPGDPWRERSIAALRSASAVVPVLSTGSLARAWSEQVAELVVAGNERRSRELALLPVRLDPCDIPPLPIGPGPTLLSDLLYIDLFPDFDDGVDRLSQQLRQLGTGRPEP